MPTQTVSQKLGSFALTSLDFMVKHTIQGCKLTDEFIEQKVVPSISKKLNVKEMAVKIGLIVTSVLGFAILPLIGKIALGIFATYKAINFFGVQLRLTASAEE